MVGHRVITGVQNDQRERDQAAGRRHRLAECASAADLVLLLNDLRTEADLSIREISRRSRHTGQSLPATTVWDMLSRQTLPRGDVLRTYLTACGVDEHDDWLAARARIARRPRPETVQAAVAIPRQLPSAGYGFVGRTAEGDDLHRLLDEQRSLAVVTGPPGVGKTAFAVQWAHQVTGRFPDGQLFVDLHGYSDRRRTRPLAALRRLLTEFGVPAEGLPADLDGVASVLRSVLAGRRVLILLDNAASADQVRPFLPGTSGSFVLVTARAALTGLVARDGAALLPLRPLADTDAVSLLDSMLGTSATVPCGDLTELARACGHLPLALRIAGATLARTSGELLADRLAQLTGGERFRALRAPGDDRSAVAAAFGLSYESLPEPAQEVFRLLGALPVGPVDVEEVAAALSTSAAVAQHALDTLVEENLAERRTGRYELHDLLRVYAAGLGGSTGAVRRAYRWSLDRVHAAAERVYPQVVRLPHDLPEDGFDTVAQALAWLDAHAVNLEAMVLAAADLGLAAYAWQLTDALRGYHMSGRSRLAWPELGSAALAAARDAGDPQAEAAARLFLGYGYEQQGRPWDAIRNFRESLRLAEECGWLEAAGSATASLGTVNSRLGRLKLADAQLSRSVELARAVNRPASEAVRLNNLATVRIHEGRLAEAQGLLEAALGLHRRSGARRGEAAVLINLGLVRRERGNLDGAVHDGVQAWQLNEEVGSVMGAAAAVKLVADVQLDAGHCRTALPLMLFALAGARKAGNAQWEASCTIGLAAVRLDLGQHDQAEVLFRRGYHLSRQACLRRAEIEALTGLAATASLQGAAQAATTHASQAYELARRGGFVLLAAKAEAQLTAFAASSDVRGDSRRRDRFAPAAHPGARWPRPVF